MVELIAGEKLVVLKKLGNPIKTGFRVARRKDVLYTILLSRYPVGDGTAPSQCSEQLVQLHLLYRFDFREANAHAQEGVRGANRARRLNPDAERLEYKSHFRAGGKRCVHFHIASVQADVGDGSPHARVVSLDSKLRAPRTPKPRALPPLFRTRHYSGRYSRHRPRPPGLRRRPAPLHRRARLFACRESRRPRPRSL